MKRLNERSFHILKKFSASEFDTQKFSISSFGRMGKNKIQ